MEIKLELLQPPMICYGADFTRPDIPWLKFEAIFREGIFSFSCAMADKIPPYPALKLTSEHQFFLDRFMALLGHREIQPEELSLITCSCHLNRFIDCKCEYGCINMHPDWLNLIRLPISSHPKP
jgi:hypothetical protein